MLFSLLFFSAALCGQVYPYSISLSRRDTHVDLRELSRSLNQSPEAGFFRHADSPLSSTASASSGGSSGAPLFSSSSSIWPSSASLRNMSASAAAGSTTSHLGHAQRSLDAHHALSRALATTGSGLDTSGLYGPFVNLAYYYAVMYVGSPEPQRFTVIIDTGSGLTAFPCKNCENCGAHMDARFDPSKSTTAHPLPCEEGCYSCAVGTADTCGYMQSYAEGSSISGLIYTDNAFVGDMDDIALSGPASHAANSPHAALTLNAFQFGCQMHEGGLFISQEADGIMGIGGGDRSVTQKLWSQGLLNRHMFSLCLNLDGGGMSMGDLQTQFHAAGAPVQWAALSATGFYVVNIKSLKAADNVFDGNAFSNGQTILDSGTSFTYLPEPTHSGSEQGLRNWCAASPSDRCRGTQVDVPNERFCFNIANPVEDLKTFPSLQFTLAGALKPDGTPGPDVIVTMPPEHLWLKMAWQRGSYCLGIYGHGAGAVLGANFMMGHDVIFDLGELSPNTPPPEDNPQGSIVKVGFASSTCTYPLSAADPTPSPSTSASSLASTSAAATVSPVGGLSPPSVEGSTLSATPTLPLPSPSSIPSNNAADGTSASPSPKARDDTSAPIPPASNDALNQAANHGAVAGAFAVLALFGGCILLAGLAAPAGSEAHCWRLRVSIVRGNAPPPTDATPASGASPASSSPSSSSSPSAGGSVGRNTQQQQQQQQQQRGKEKPANQSSVKGTQATATVAPGAASRKTPQPASGPPSMVVGGSGGGRNRLLHSGGIRGGGATRAAENEEDNEGLQLTAQTSSSAIDDAEIELGDEEEEELGATQNEDDFSGGSRRGGGGRGLPASSVAIKVAAAASSKLGSTPQQKKAPPSSGGAPASSATKTTAKAGGESHHVSANSPTPSSDSNTAPSDKERSIVDAIFSGSGGGGGGGAPRAGHQETRGDADEDEDDEDADLQSAVLEGKQRAAAAAASSAQKKKSLTQQRK